MIPVETMCRQVTVEKLIKGSENLLELVSGNANTPVLSVEYDSRKVRRNSLFVAIEGFSSDGHGFVKTAVTSGASTVVISRSRLAEFAGLEQSGTAIIVSDDTRSALSKISAAFFGYPSRFMRVIGITGTNGKTSTTYMLESIAKAAGFSPGVIGTVDYRWKGRSEASPNTTPESRDLQELVFRMSADGVDCLIMEVSSHGLELSRADDIDFDVVAFTNLTRDHLDFHRDFEHYFTAKRRIFSLAEKSAKNNKAGIVNIDDPYGKEIFSAKGQWSYPLFGIGLDAGADFSVKKESIVNTISGVSYEVRFPGGKMHVALSLGGRFNVYNSLVALASAYCLGIPQNAILEGLSWLDNVPGRFDRLSSKLGFHVVVDYAHTDDALHKLLLSVRELSPARIITVFGCGGNRDKSKRPLMGRAAAELSDLAIITSDNPRNENPEAIISDILSGIESGNYEIEIDRRKAIARAIEIAKEGDIVVIAGKGHEDYQIFGTEKRHFDDRETAREFITAREAR